MGMLLQNLLILAFSLVIYIGMMLNYSLRISKEVEVTGSCTTWDLKLAPEDMEWFGDVLVMSALNYVKILHEEID